MSYSSNSIRLYPLPPFLERAVLYRVFLFVIGTIGGTLSILVFNPQFHQNPLNGSSDRFELSPSYYLSAVAVSDMCFLLSFLVSPALMLPVLGYGSGENFAKLLCPFITFLQRISSFLSVYLVLALSTERYVSIHHPLLRGTVCSRSRSKLRIIGLVIIALVIYSHVWITTTKTGPESEEEGRANHSNVNLPTAWEVQRNGCDATSGYAGVTEILNGIDFVLTLIFPVFVIGFINLRILWKVWSVRKEQRVRAEQVEPEMRGPSHLSLVTIPSPFRASSVHSGSGCGGPTSASAEGHPAYQPNSTLREFKVTSLMLLVSSTGLIFNFPQVIVESSYFFQITFLQAGQDDDDKNGEDGGWNTFMRSVTPIASCLFVAGFARNFFIYFLFDLNFRRSLKTLLSRRRRPVQSA